MLRTKIALHVWNIGSAMVLMLRVRNGAGSELWEAAVTGDVQTVCYWLYVECGGAP